MVDETIEINKEVRAHDRALKWGSNGLKELNPRVLMECSKLIQTEETDEGERKELGAKSWNNKISMRLMLSFLCPAYAS